VREVRVRERSCRGRRKRFLSEFSSRKYIIYEHSHQRERERERFYSSFRGERERPAESESLAERERAEAEPERREAVREFCLPSQCFLPERGEILCRMPSFRERRSLLFLREFRGYRESSERSL